MTASFSLRGWGGK